MGGGKIKDATAVPSDVVSGKVFYNNDGKQVGTLSDKNIFKVLDALSIKTNLMYRSMAISPYSYQKKSIVVENPYGEHQILVRGLKGNGFLKDGQYISNDFYPVVVRNCQIPLSNILYMETNMDGDVCKIQIPESSTRHMIIVFGGNNTCGILLGVSGSTLISVEYVYYSRDAQHNPNANIDVKIVYV